MEETVSQIYFAHMVIHLHFAKGVAGSQGWATKATNATNATKATKVTKRQSDIPINVVMEGASDATPTCASATHNEIQMLRSGVYHEVRRIKMLVA